MSFLSHLTAKAGMQKFILNKFSNWAEQMANIMGVTVADIYIRIDIADGQYYAHLANTKNDISKPVPFPIAELGPIRQKIDQSVETAASSWGVTPEMVLGLLRMKGTMPALRLVNKHNQGQFIDFD